MNYKHQGIILQRVLFLKPERYLKTQMKSILQKKSVFMIILLCMALILSIASSRKPKDSQSPKNPTILSEEAPALGHPALVIMNTTTCPIKIVLKGKTDRKLLLVPMGAFRTLIAAGRYSMKIQNEEVCRIGVEESMELHLERGRRYFLRLPPRDSD